MAGCTDIEGASVDCGSSDAVSIGGGYAITGTTVDLSSNPVAAQAASSNGGSSIFGSILNFGSTLAPSIIKAVSSPTAPSGLVLQLNPATGQMQYYNPTTGQYVGGAVSSGGILGGNSWIFLVFALVVAFFAFGGKKRLAAA